jgi:hypothetical protein
MDNHEAIIFAFTYEVNFLCIYNRQTCYYSTLGVGYHPKLKIIVSRFVLNVS